MYNIGTLSTGSHSVTAVGYDSLNGSATLGTARTVTVAGNTPPEGWLDLAVNPVNRSTSIGRGGNLQLVGWAVDYQQSAPVSRVELRIDGNAVGNATTGLARPDVASAYGRSDFTNSGWTITYNIGNLSLGPHNATIVAYDNLNASATIGSATITVVTGAAPEGWLDLAVNITNGSAVIPQFTQMRVVGWAVDYDEGAPIALVALRIDDNPIGDAVLGLNRPDVANAYGRADYLQSGWMLDYPIGALAPGPHTVSAVAFDRGNNTTIIGSKQITVP
jgi:hypothetical protein